MDTTTFISMTQRITKRLCLQGTRKIECHATIRIKTFILYAEYAIVDVSGKSAHQIKLLQESQLELLRKAIAKRDEICKNFVSLPSEAAHSGHPTGSSGGYAQKIHPFFPTKKKKTGHCATLIQGPYLTERPQPPS